MSDIKIADMTQWTGNVPAAAVVPMVYLNANYKIAMSQITPYTVTGATGTFTSADGKTISVQNGLITAIEANSDLTSFIAMENQ